MWTVLLVIWAVGFAAVLACSISVILEAKGNGWSRLLLFITFFVLSVIWPLSVVALARCRKGE